MLFQYVKEVYKVPAEYGRRVSLNGEFGTICEDRGHYVGVNFDKDKPGVIKNCHPSELTYGDIGEVRKLTQGQKRYKEYRESECDCSFAEWLGVAKTKKQYGDSYGYY